RAQGAPPLVAGEQFNQCSVIETPVIGDDRQIEQPAVFTGEIEIEHAGQLAVLTPQDVVTKEVGVDDAAWQDGEILGRLKGQFVAEQGALGGQQQGQQGLAGGLSPGGPAGIGQG